MRRGNITFILLYFTYTKSRRADFFIPDIMLNNDFFYLKKLRDSCLVMRLIHRSEFYKIDPFRLKFSVFYLIEV